MIPFERRDRMSRKQEVDRSEQMIHHFRPDRSSTSWARCVGRSRPSSCRHQSGCSR
jgi:hypothetical protein